MGCAGFLESRSFEEEEEAEAEEEEEEQEQEQEEEGRTRRKVRTSDKVVFLDWRVVLF